MISSEKARKDRERMRPDFGSSLGIAKVINLDYEEFFVTLKTIFGTPSSFVRAPVPMTFPGAGARHFFAAMPQVGDYCVIGWMNQESSQKGERSPVILAWMLPGVWPGRDWVTTAEFEKDEYDIESPKDKALYDGIFNPIRHKLRHIQPGNIVGSSAQGADLVLDEGVTLANRRGNEFRLRDQDQAAITRALQRFDALAGVRSYHGMVQRDAALLAPYMVSDGLKWDAKKQMEGGEPIAQGDLPSDPDAFEGLLTPAGVFRKNKDQDGTFRRPGFQLGQDLDPYEFLKRGGFLNSSGFVVEDNKHEPSAIYGGKPILRVAAQNSANATLDPDARTLTEYRVEVTHTSDGRLPVTEQTDMFDAERLPPNDQKGTKEVPPNSPFIEWVLGSVVGNDVYSESGRQQYGVPLKAVIFDGGKAAPRLEPIALPVDPNNQEVPVPLEEHAATLFRLSPVSGASPGTFWSVNKKGQLKASIGGPTGENSVEAFLNGALKLQAAGGFDFNQAGSLNLSSSSRGSIGITAEEGSVRIFGNGPVKDSSAMGERLFGTGRGESDLPAVRIEARTNAHLKAGKKVLVTGNEVDIQGPSVHLRGNQEVQIDAVDRIGMSTETLSKTINGKASESYSGPKNLLPTNGALHERSYSHLFAGTCEDVTYNLGDREELFILGNHDTTILIGDQSYTSVVGKFRAQGTTSFMELAPSGITGTALVGSVALTATAGSASMTGLSSASLISLAGPAIVRGATSVYLGAPVTGTDFGGILASCSREPFTNLPFITWGIGSKNHLIGV
jgi:hypothetical protein